MSSIRMSKEGCGSGNCGCGCGGGASRRDFLRMTGTSSLALLASRLPVMAGPFEATDFDAMVPADKKLDPAWVKSLFERGQPTAYRGADLKYIGMPVGGLCTGQLYLGGDGKLWCWDIFNQAVATGDGHYAKPPESASPVEQSFSLTIADRPLPLDGTGFSDVSFLGQYPVGTVTYKRADVPVEVKLEAFSPFIPLNTDDSSLPATVLRFTVRNTSGAAVDATLTGKLENAVCLYHRDAAATRRNRVVTGNGFTFIECSAERTDTVIAPPQPDILFEDWPDNGTMGLALLGAPADTTSDEKVVPLSEKLVAEIARKLKLEAGQSATVTFLVTWFFPNLRHLPGVPVQGRYYASRFDSALTVARYIAENADRLVSQTLLWRDTWYDSTLPFWFLDRTFLNTSILASSTCYRFEDGRFWAWEGVGCCAGTCAHVWHYAQAAGRQFPELERILRERTDFGLAMLPDGAIRFRGENNAGPAIDAQAGAILRSLREHQMSADDAFLRRVWPGVKRATQWLIAQDGNGDGILEGAQHNTLDTDWYGPVAWLSGLYLAALQAAAVMADERKDRAFAQKCRDILKKGQKKLVADLFDGEYFYNKVDPRRPDTVNSGTGCEIDQVLGQSWAFQVGLPRVLPEKETRTALRSLWRYNFSPDVGPYREKNKPGRWYAVAGEAGLLMCTFPRKGWDYEKAKGGAGKGAWAAMYFNECMNGFEHQAAGHMIWEGMVQEGLAVERAVHDRYHASKRNPWNEVECGDHYARSMASYGVFLAACGFTYNGPKGQIGFAPRLTPEDFKAPFTAAEGWGTYSQRSEGRDRRSEIAVKWGQLKLRTLVLAAAKMPAGTTVTLAGQSVAATRHFEDGSLTVTLAEPVAVTPGRTLEVVVNEG